MGRMLPLKPFPYQCPDGRGTPDCFLQSLIQWIRVANAPFHAPISRGDVSPLFLAAIVLERGNCKLETANFGPVLQCAKNPKKTPMSKTFVRHLQASFHASFECLR